MTEGNVVDASTFKLHGFGIQKVYKFSLLWSKQIIVQYKYTAKTFQVKIMIVKSYVRNVRFRVSNLESET